MPAPLGLIVFPVALILVGVATAYYFRDDLMLHVVIITATGIAACVYSYAHVHGPPVGYFLVWPRVIAMFCVVAPLMILARRSAALARPSYRDFEIPAVAVILIALAGQAIQAMRSDLSEGREIRMYEKFVPAIEQAVPPGTTIRIAASRVPFTVSESTLAMILLRAGRKPLMPSWVTHGAGAHRCIDDEAVVPTMVLTSGSGVDLIGQRPGARLLVSYDPVSPADRLAARPLRDTLAQQFRDVRREDLVRALDDGQEWLNRASSPAVDRSMLERYLNLVGGEERRAYAVYLLPPTTW